MTSAQTPLFSILTWAVVVALATTGAGGTAAPVPAVTALLDMYASGQFDDAVNLAVGPDGRPTAGLRDGLKREAPPWAAQEGPEQADRRRLIAATFALDAAHRVYARFQQRHGYAPSQGLSFTGLQLFPQLTVPGWEDAEPILEWACGWLRHFPPTGPLERDWFIASVQLARDFNDRAAAVVPVYGATGEYGAFRGHLEDARYRFPDEPWFRVVSAERQAHSEKTFGKDHWERAVQAEYRQITTSGSDIPAWEADQVLADLLEMRRVLTPIENEPSVRAEVHVHLGCIASICGEHDRARRDLDDVAAWTADPCLQYLGHLLRGRVDDADGRLADAEASYRAALAILPETPSGLSALAGVLALGNERVEAARLARRVFTVPPATPDPSVEFWKGTGCTRWPAAMRRLREGLRPR